MFKKEKSKRKKKVGSTWGGGIKKPKEEEWVSAEQCVCTHMHTFLFVILTKTDDRFSKGQNTKMTKLHKNQS